MTAEVIQGDCLDVLRGMDAGAFDAVICDPPYSSGGMVRGDRTNGVAAKYTGYTIGGRQKAGRYSDFAGDCRDQRGYLAWASLWLSECLRATRIGGVCLVFTDWRQLPTVTDSLQAGGWVWRGIIVWDKLFCRPMRGRFRSQAEFVVWGSNGPMGREHAVYLPNVYQEVPPKDRDHMTQKPVSLLRQLVKICPPGGRVLDPFGGSGTTAVAALKEGRSAVLIEKEAAYVDIARRRIAEAQAETPLFAEVA